MSKNKLITTCLFLILAFTMTQISSANDNTSNYPDIVAKVANYEITGSEFAKQVKETKHAYELNNQPQNIDFYEKTVMKKLIASKLVDQVVNVKNISATDQEAKEYLKTSIAAFEALDDTDINKNYFFDGIKKMGFSDFDSYINNENVINATKKILARNKLAKQISMLTKEPTDQDIDKYIEAQSKIEPGILDVKDDELLRKQIKEYLYQKGKISSFEEYKKELLAKGNFEIFIDIEIQ